MKKGKGAPKSETRSKKIYKGNKQVDLFMVAI